MGEMADDCYDRMFDEMERFDSDPDYYGYHYSDGTYGYHYSGSTYDPSDFIPRRRASFSARVTRPSADDFDTVDPPEDDCSDLL